MKKSLFPECHRLGSALKFLFSHHASQGTLYDERDLLLGHGVDNLWALRIAMVLALCALFTIWLDMLLSPSVITALAFFVLFSCVCHYAINLPRAGLTDALNSEARDAGRRYETRSYFGGRILFTPQGLKLRRKGQSKAKSKQQPQSESGAQPQAESQPDPEQQPQKHSDPEPEQQSAGATDTAANQSASACNQDRAGQTEQPTEQGQDEQRSWKQRAQHWLSHVGVLVSAATTEKDLLAQTAASDDLPVVQSGYMQVNVPPSLQEQRIYSGVPVSLQQLVDLTSFQVPELSQIAGKQLLPSDVCCLGFGFPWLPKHTRRLHDLMEVGLRASPFGKKGSPDLHGVEDRHAFEPIYFASELLLGHTLLLGTTGAGKTRFFDLLVTQAIMRGDTVIVIDPKGDRSLQQSILRAARFSGRQPLDSIYCLDIGRKQAAPLSSPIGQSFVERCSGLVWPLGSKNYPRQSCNKFRLSSKKLAAIQERQERKGIAAAQANNRPRNFDLTSVLSRDTPEPFSTTPASLRAESKGLAPISSMSSLGGAGAKQCQGGTPLGMDEKAEADWFFDNINTGFNPTSAFDRATEIGDRLTAMMSSDGAAASFKAYANMAISAAVECCLLNNEAVTLERLRSIVSHHESFEQTIRNYLNQVVIQLDIPEVSIYYNRLHSIKDPKLQRRCFAVSLILGSPETGNTASMSEQEALEVLERMEVKEAAESSAHQDDLAVFGDELDEIFANKDSPDIASKDLAVNTAAEAPEERSNAHIDDSVSAEQTKTQTADPAASEPSSTELPASLLATVQNVASEELEAMSTTGVSYFADTLNDQDNSVVQSIKQLHSSEELMSSQLKARALKQKTKAASASASASATDTDTDNSNGKCSVADLDNTGLDSAAAESAPDAAKATTSRAKRTRRTSTKKTATAETAGIAATSEGTASDLHVSGVASSANFSANFSAHSDTTDADIGESSTENKKTTARGRKSSSSKSSKTASTRGVSPASYTALLGFYRWLKKKKLITTSYGVDQIITISTMSADYYKKVTNGILPYLSALTSGDLLGLLSSSEQKLPSFIELVRHNKIFYAALHCLKDSATGQALGKLLISDLAFVAGELNAQGDSDHHRVSIFIDEAAELAQESLVQLLNKARASKFSITLATQCVADLARRAGSAEAASQIIANCNNLISLRVNDPQSAKVIASVLPQTVIAERSSSQSRSEGLALNDSYSTSRSVMQKESPLFPPSMLTQLPDFEFIARLANGSFYKGFIPLLTTSSKAGNALNSSNAASSDTAGLAGPASPAGTAASCASTASPDSFAGSASTSVDANQGSSASSAPSTSSSSNSYGSPDISNAGNVSNGSDSCYRRAGSTSCTADYDDIYAQSQLVDLGYQPYQRANTSQTNKNQWQSTSQSAFASQDSHSQAYGSAYEQTLRSDCDSVDQAVPPLQPESAQTEQSAPDSALGAATATASAAAEAVDTAASTAMDTSAHFAASPNEPFAAPNSAMSGSGSGSGSSGCCGSGRDSGNSDSGDSSGSTRDSGVRDGSGNTSQQSSAHRFSYHFVDMSPAFEKGGNRLDHEAKQLGGITPPVFTQPQFLGSTDSFAFKNYSDDYYRAPHRASIEHPDNNTVTPIVLEALAESCNKFDREYVLAHPEAAPKTGTLGLLVRLTQEAKAKAKAQAQAKAKEQAQQAQTETPTSQGSNCSSEATAEACTTQGSTTANTAANHVHKATALLRSCWQRLVPSLRKFGIWLLKAVITVMLSLPMLTLYQRAFECLLVLLMTVAVSFIGQGFTAFSELFGSMGQTLSYIGTMFSVLTSGVYELNTAISINESFWSRSWQVVIVYRDLWPVALSLLTTGLLLGQNFSLIAEMRHRSLMGLKKFTSFMGWPAVTLMILAAYVLATAFVLCVEVSVLIAWLFTFNLGFSTACFYTQHLK